MSEKFPNIRHVILDEVQAFRDEDGDWLRKARRLVRQHASGDDDPGYLWGFIDRNQINHTFRTGIPVRFQQTRRLTRVIRNPRQIFNFAEEFLNDVSARRKPSIDHDFDGEGVRVVTYQEGQQTNKL